MSDALEALEKLRENVRHPAGIEFGGLRDNEETRTAIVALMEFASAALEQGEQGEAVATVSSFSIGDGGPRLKHLSVHEEIENLPDGTKLYAAPPSTAEAQAIEALKDPSVVYLNIMRGIIGKPSWSHIQELYPEAKEAQARALVEFAMGLKQQAQQTHSMFSEGLLHAATYAEAEAKRIREEG